MKKILLASLIITLILGSFAAGWLLKEKNTLMYKSILSKTNTKEQEKPLLKYTIENLSKSKVPVGEYNIISVQSSEKAFETSVVSLEFSPDLDPENIKIVSALVNVPDKDSRYPLVLMLRGYVDPSIYYSGLGTARGAEFFASNGFITIAPDFLGYASSDENAADIFESRFQTYTTAIAFLESLGSTSFNETVTNKWDGKNIFIWAHSNGGQIALTLLETTERNIPTTLWAPVSKPFPYSVLYYTDESIDNGKFIRSELSKFEELYNVDDFSFTNHFDKLQTKIQIHQGGKDDAIPLEWSEELTIDLQSHKVDVTFFVYPNADHDMRPNWDEVIQRDLAFFQSQMNE